MDIKWQIQSQNCLAWIVCSSSFYALFCIEIHLKMNKFSINVLFVCYCEMAYGHKEDEEDEGEE